MSGEHEAPKVEPGSTSQMGLGSHGCIPFVEGGLMEDLATGSQATFSGQGHPQRFKQALKRGKKKNESNGQLNAFRRNRVFGRGSRNRAQRAQVFVDEAPSKRKTYVAQLADSGFSS